ncbi:Glucooligosaccharide oxidase [Cucurbitaria berberidis CBS 394.84]|uniref:Glucooligosaccharide oxidase n=1 Tax=Cucurbitaria berberidis CBS 394.84 TaxID=1168544 RepID=A0A9P4GLG4_9PLEO|nr:Glucooligosaccharide oxidase [Cucurbitaria berberidis CBS 394.84]KAF1847770.1 Glucooligosaccharide oxidase [Cucurbitaria berberidis CBS 394.84]
MSDIAALVRGAADGRLIITEIPSKGNHQIPLRAGPKPLTRSLRVSGERLFVIAQLLYHRRPLQIHKLRHIMAPRRLINEKNIAELRQLLKDTDAQLVTPDEQEPYNTSIRRWSRAAEKPAGACLIPKSNEAISITVKYATQHNLDIAVKGGGHSTAGASSTDGGLLIDLNTHMRTTEVDVEKKTIRVGGGAVWGEVDAALAPHGLAAVGGTVADTGVGGLTLGGGFGFLTVKHGLVADNLLECTVVLADGRIVKSSASENTDLFWALRGAGQNFGVVTEFLFRAHEQGDMWAGFMMFPPTPEIISKAVEACNSIFKPDATGNSKATGKLVSLIGIVKPPPSGQTVLLVAAAFHGTEDEGKELFKDVLALEPVINTMAMISYEKANKLMAPPIGARVSLKGSSFELPIRPDFVVSILEAYTKFTDEVSDALGSQVMWELLDPTKIIEVSNSSMAFANRGRHFNAAIAPLWWDAANDEVCRQWSRDVALLFKTELERDGAETGGSGDGWIGKRGEHGATMVYGNYDQYEERSKDVFGANHERLQELKAKYDPENLFNKLFAITPKAQGTP